MCVSTFRKGPWFTARRLINKGIPATYHLEQGRPQSTLILCGVDKKCTIIFFFFWSIKVSLETTRSVLVYKESASFLIAIRS